MKGRARVGLFLAVVLMAGVASATTTLSTLSVVGPSTPVIVGNTFDLTISVDSAASLEGLQFTLAYDPTLMSLNPTVNTTGGINTTTGDCGTGVSVTGLVTASWTLRCNTATGQVSVAMLGVDEDAATPGELPLSLTSETNLLKISFIADAAGTSNLILSNVLFGDLSAAEIPSAKSDDTLRIFTTTPVALDLVNPTTGNPADQDYISVVRGSTVSIKINLNGSNVGGTANDIGYDTAVFTSPTAAIGTVASNAGKIIVTSTPSAGVFRVGITGFNTNVIANGTVATVTFTVASTATPGDYTLTNLPSSTTPGGADLETIGSDAIIRVRDCTLCISKTAYSNDPLDGVIGGHELIYYLYYENFGSAASNVVINDTVPTNTTFVSALDGGTESGGVVTWNIGSVASGGAGEVSFVVTVSSGVTDKSAVSNTIYSIEATGISAYSGAQVDSTVRNPDNIVQLNLSDGSGVIGGSGSVGMTLLAGSQHSVASVSMDIAYDPSVFSNFACVINPAIGAGTTPNKICQTSNPSSAVFRVGILGFNTTVIPNGAVATVTFDVAANSSICSVPFEFMNTPSASTPNGIDIADTFGTGADVNILCLSVSSITPDVATTFGGCPVVVGGAGFQSGATLTIGGKAATQVSVVDSSTITAVTPSGTANAGSAPDVHEVVVTNPDSSSASAILFTYVNPGDFKNTAGNLNSDGHVSIGEVQSAINMFLTGLSVRPQMDSNCDGQEKINEVQQAINSFLVLP